MAEAPIKLRAKRGESASATANRVVLENRRLLRKAYDLVWHDANEQAFVTRIAMALSGRAPATNALLDKARQTVGVE